MTEYTKYDYNQRTNELLYGGLNCEICGRSFELYNKSRYTEGRCTRCDLLVYWVREFAGKLGGDAIDIALFEEYLVNEKSWHGKIPDRRLLNPIIHAAGYSVVESPQIIRRTPERYTRQSRQLERKHQRRRQENKINRKLSDWSTPMAIC